MKTKTVSGIMLTLLILSMLTLAFNVQRVKAEPGTIVIEADGSINPPTANITSVDNVTYTFNGSISDEIVVERSNIVVDGNGYMLEGSGSGGGFRLSSVNNVTIQNTNINNFNTGVYLSWSSNNTVSGNNITNNDYGVYLSSSSNNTFSSNTITNSAIGVVLGSSSNNNTVSGNTITNITSTGVYLSSSSNNTVSSNTITNNTFAGVYLSSSSNNTVSGNTIANSTLYGVELSSSSNNAFYHNNFVDNTQQVYIATPGYANFWNSSYPSGGNYWSNYTGGDLYSGPHQNETGSDGIGDTPHILDDWNQDNYPLMEPWPPVPLVADAGGPYIADEGSPITFDASGSSDPDGDALQFRWDFDNDGNWDTSYSTDPTATHTWNDDYTDEVKVEVYDGEYTDTDTATVTVNNVAPMVEAGPDQTVNEGDLVSFSGSFTDPGTDDTHTYEWDFGDGSPVATGTLTPTHVYADQGTYAVSLTVTDDDGGIGVYTLTVTVNNVAPTADLGNDSPKDEGSTVTVSFTNQFDPGTLDTFTYSFDWNNDGIYEIVDQASASATHTWYDNGVYNVRGRIKDNDGGQSEYTTDVTVNNVAPTASIDDVVQPYSEFILPTDELEFYGSYSDPGTSDTHTYEWHFGDTTTITGTLTPTHAYADPGVYTVTFTVTDDDGGVGTASVEITVESPAEATEDVIEDVEEMGLPSGMENSLTSQLENIIRLLDEGHDNAAVNQLEAFINQVESQRGKKLTDEEADALVEAAQTILQNIS